jgi:hypothetical protein
MKKVKDKGTGVLGQDLNRNWEVKKTVQIEDSPFAAVWIEQENSFVIIIGNEVMTNPKEMVFESIDEVQAWIDTKPWELIVKAAAVFTNKFNELNKK